MQKFSGVFCVLLACGSSTAAISGKIVLSGESDASVVAVTLTGVNHVQTAVTAADGSYAFTNADNGGYQLQASVGDSLEHTESMAVNYAGKPITAGTMTFTIVGTVTGQVTASGATDNSGISVTILGTQGQALTDAGGNYTLTNVPLGNHVVAASGAAGVAQAPIVVARGTTAAPALTLGPAAATATITGHVVFAGDQAPTLITVSAQGSSATSPVAADGSFSLSVPPGTYIITASAPNYPVDTLAASVTIAAGATTDIGLSTMSFFVYPNIVGILGGGPSALLANGLFLAEASIVQGTTQTPSGSFWLVDPKTAAARVVWVGDTFADMTPSPSGNYVAFTASTTTPSAQWILNTQTLAVQLMPWVTATPPLFTSDESAVAVSIDDTTEEIMNLASGATSVQTVPSNYFLAYDDYALSQGNVVVFADPTTKDVYVQKFDGSAPSISAPAAATTDEDTSKALTDIPLANANGGVATSAVFVHLNTTGGAIFTPDGIMHSYSNVRASGDLCSPPANAAPWIICPNGAKATLVPATGGGVMSLPNANAGSVLFSDSASSVAYTSTTASCVDAVSEGATGTCATPLPAALFVDSSSVIFGWLSDTRLYAVDDVTNKLYQNLTEDAPSPIAITDGTLDVDAAFWTVASDGKQFAASGNATPVAIPNARGVYNSFKKSPDGKWGFVSIRDPSSLPLGVVRFNFSDGTSTFIPAFGDAGDGTASNVSFLGDEPVDFAATGPSRIELNDGSQSISLREPNIGFVSTVAVLPTGQAFLSAARVNNDFVPVTLGIAIQP